MLGQGTSLHPISALLAIMLFGSVWGVTGMVMAVPLTAVCRIYLEAIDHPLSLHLAHALLRLPCGQPLHLAQLPFSFLSLSGLFFVHGQGLDMASVAFGLLVVPPLPWSRQSWDSVFLIWCRFPVPPFVTEPMEFKP